MQETSCGRLTCIGCQLPFERIPGRGRPRIRCTSCSPEQTKAPGTYVTDRSRAAYCMNTRCGRPFTATHGQTQYCSATCRLQANNRAAQERARDRSARPCKACGEPFAPAYGDQRKTICSDACKAKVHSQRTSGTTHGRRAKRFGGAYEPIDRLEIMERDGWTCYLCGIPTPKDLSGLRLPNSPELEHVLPLSKGGSHTPTNLRCACHACNRAKGDMTLEQFQNVKPGGAGSTSEALRFQDRTSSSFCIASLPG